MKRLSRDHTVPLDSRYRVFESVMTVEPGETIVVETINHMTPIVRTENDLHPHGSPEYREREETGPIAVKGAQPSDMLAVHIGRIEIIGLPHAHGCGPLSDAYPQKPMAFPVEGGACRLPGGVSVPLTPMIGDIYTTPASPSAPYFDHGGNMDFTEVRPGNTLYLPVQRDGGLLVLGDVHAVQGDGEIYGEGAETAADVTITLDIDRVYRCARPLVETRDSLISLACRGGLFESLTLATQDMTELLARVYGLSENDAYVYCALVGSVRMAGCLCSKEGAERMCLIGLSIPLDPIRKTAPR